MAKVFTFHGEKNVSEGSLQHESQDQVLKVRMILTFKRNHGYLVMWKHWKEPWAVFSSRKHLNPSIVLY